MVEQTENKRQDVVKSAPEEVPILRVSPLPEHFHRLMKKIVLITIVFCMVVGLLGSLGTKTEPFDMVFIYGPSFGLLIAAFIYASAYGFFLGHRKHSFVGNEEGIHITVSDFDDVVPWDHVKDVCVRSNNIHINTTVRIGSFELYFTDPVASDLLYRMHHERCGYGRKRD